MALTVDVYGSCVGIDLFRYVDPAKYKFSRCVTQVPISTLYEPVLQFENADVERLALSSYENTMFRIQTGKILPQLLKKNKSDYLIIDLADELMRRCEIQGETETQLAMVEGKETAYEPLFAKENRFMQGPSFSPTDMDLRTIERKYKKFASELVTSEKNPDGYRQDQIVILEAMYTADIMGNEGSLHTHNKKYSIKKSNAWLKQLYEILEKYIPGAQVIHFPDMTHATQNHLNGVHPLHYMADTYAFFEKTLDVITHYSNQNTTENLWREQSLKNKLETRVAKSSMMYSMRTQIQELQKKLKKLENQINT